jgi:hypothetical protein
MDITGITISMTAVDGSKIAAVDRIAVDRAQVRAGETVEISAFVRTGSGRMMVQKVPVVIPADTAPGVISVMLGDGNAVQLNTAVTQFVPKTAAELITTINRLKRADRLYARLSRTSSGAVIGTSEMPNLPPSVLATINNDRAAGGSKATVQTIITEKELPASDYIVSGSQTLSIEVIR